MKQIFHSINGKITHEQDAHISPFDIGLLRGYAVFDYAPVYKGQSFHLADHIARLRENALIIGLSVPYTDEEIATFCEELLERNPAVNAGLRMVLTGGIATDSITHEGNSQLLLLFQRFDGYPEHVYKKGMKVITTNTLRLLPHIKTTNYMPAVMALNGAKKQGADDILYISDSQELLEGSTCNAFFIKDGFLHTSASSNIVQGVTRKIVLDIAKDIMPIKTCPISVHNVHSCSEAFLTSSMKDLIPLTQVDNTPIGSGIPGPVTKRLREAFYDYVNDYFSKKRSTVCQLS